VKLLNLNLDFRFLKRHFFTPLDFKRRLEILEKEVKNLNPEMITFQEVPDLFPVIKLKKIFKNYSFIYQGFLKISGGLLSLYKAKKWRLVARDFMAFAKQGKFFSRQLADRILRKGILVTVFENKKTAKKLLLINLHLTANYGQRLKDEEREILKIQLAQIEKILKKYKKGFDIRLITGDFNADFNDQTLQAWLRRINFQAAFGKKVCTVCPSRNPLCHRDQKKDFLIDNILSQGGQKISPRLLFNRKGRFISDHYGQLVEIKF